MTATKEQERKALEQIKKIVEELGEDSYVGAAFEGCFEMAESNIESDFGCSYKQSYEKALEDENYFKDLAERKSTEKDELQKQLDTVNRRVLSKGEVSTLWSILNDRHHEDVDKISENEKKILEFCEDTDSKEFHVAVGNRKIYKQMVEEEEKLETRLYEINEAY